MYTHILCRAGVELNIYEFLSRVFGGGSSTAAVCDVIIYLATPGIVFHPVSGGRAQTSPPMWVGAAQNSLGNSSTKH